MAIYQIFVKLLDGETRCLQIPSPTISGESMKTELHRKTNIPLNSIRLITGSRVIHDETLFSASADGTFPSCTLLLRLPGGKGGFGSLLRGAATKAGQKKTNNFDACRDMSGRRLRHVNAEKKLEEWKAEAEDRKLEKIAEQFLKKKAKEVKKSSSKEVDKYIEKYKEDSERCMREMEESVRQSFSLYEKSKRKVLPTSGPASKRLKILLGKKKVDESESDSDDDDEADGADEKSIVLDDGNQKDDGGSSGTVSGSHLDGESSGGDSSQSNLEEEANEVYGHGGSVQVGEASGSGISNNDSDGSAEPEIAVHEETAVQSSIISSLEGPLQQEEIMVGAVNSEVISQEQMDTQSTVTSLPENLSPLESNMKEGSLEPMLIIKQLDAQDTMASSHKELPVSDKVNLAVEKSDEPESIVHTDTAVQSSPVTDSEPLNFDNFSSAAELEVLGMDRLKMELQAEGLKCGGTLQERAARLFLLKTTPIDKLPKKLLAKPLGGK